ncbi:MULTISPECIES: ABC transporter permease [unclassified Pseudomonas]|uniref:ABC transporter permease n=1 Tax=unclassified Pseudomonas TaxID=196821 RepID=UPI0011A4815E|nr:MULTISPECIES: ABC transporter permease [unclassified Pseudomonas]TWC06473.1 peptide/nickel transport system permease protein [Pseudomonas sp. SJZ075]TWC25404.1 peptide/nickel transport system permease protein [Pseudomonas sp. SJZ078]TWC44489.1 peptide/nickel transport system permease protein [Pseudomonas sp. SJZ124]TWC79746.1 peptide/nickel transport system permease protein [Pseudomonas sp. SJZ101]
MNLARYRFVLIRPLQLLPVLLGISLITFVLVRSIPGDPARVLLGTRSTPDAIQKIRAQFGLDEPIWVQYLYFLKNLLNGDLGKSLLYKIDALPLIASRIEPTLMLVLGSVLLALLIAVPLAVLAARHKGGWTDNLIRLFTTAGLGLPAFWLGLMLILLFSVYWGLFPVSGYGRTWADKLHHLVLPCLTIALALSAVLVRNLRASILLETQADHVVAARARGLGEGALLRRHILPNSMVPTINLLAVNIGWLISSTVVIESLFSLPGIGQLLVRGIFTRDYMVVQGVAMVLACASVAVNFLADVLTIALDPRVKIQ